MFASGLATVPEIAALPTGRVAIRPWPDPVLDRAGHDPRSAYVERFWLGILGPTATWLLRHLAAGLEAEPGGFELCLDDTATALGLRRKGGRNAPIVRTIARCCAFHLCRAGEAAGELEVRGKLPTLSRNQLARLPNDLQNAHRRWQTLPTADDPVRELLRARRLALSLVELGEDLEATERHLLGWRFHPSLARDAAAWSWDRHRRALVAAGPAARET
jgi:hypothetical protein